MKKNKTLTIFFVILVAFFLMLSIVACNEEKKEKTDATNNTTTEDKLQKSTEDTTTKTEKMVLRFNNGAEPQTLDPAIMTGVPEIRIVLQIFEGLTMYNPKDLSADAGVAEKWEVSEDGLTWTFYLRQNAKWSDGTPIDAETFAYSWRRALAPETAADYAYYLWYIKNAKKYTNGEVAVEEVGIEVVDAYTLRVVLEKPTPFFLSLTSFQTYFPVPRHIIEKTSNDTWYKLENIVCNGAFKVVDWKPQQILKLVKNVEYWDKDKVKLDEIEVYPYEDDNSALEMFLNGELDWITEVPSERIDEMLNNPEYHRADYLGTYFYRLNVTRKPLDDVRVRKALAMTIDRDYIVRYIGKVGQIPAYGFVPSNMPNYTATETELEEDEVEAKKLLAEAGFPEGKGFPALSILYNTSDEHKKVAEAIQQMWKKKLGIDVILENQEWQIYLDSQNKLNYDISRSGWIGDYIDPNTFLDVFITGSGNNNTGWSNPKYDELMKNATYELDPVKRMEYFNEAEKLLISEVPIIPIYYYVNKYMLKSSVEGFYGNILDLHSLKEVSIKKVQ